LPRRAPLLLAECARRQLPETDGLEALITAGRVLVDGVVRTNPSALVRPDARVTIVGPTVLRGEAKLRAALTAFHVPVSGRVALDIGASAGGFTKVLLECGARRVYAVDAGHGQLLGSLRQDARVVNLEATNVGDLSTTLVPESIDLVTIDVSYLSLSSAAEQANRASITPGAYLVGLVKPMFELRRPTPPADAADLTRALSVAVAGVEAAGWRVVGTMDSPVRGARGAVEMLLAAERPRA
jgi:23S rRNA (cytidine1920-2'-O)/16S rRNA (cytidine1409-2'-O)-methyltransferase